MAKHTVVHLRAETKPLEHRCVLSPSAITTLVNSGYEVNCERSDQRCFRDEEMEAAGATLVPAKSWPDVPQDHIILGLKELLPSEEFPLKHIHLHFAHIFKDQPGWTGVMRRFAHGGGSLLDIEFLKDPGSNNRLLAPTSFHAGFCGAVLALQAWSQKVFQPEQPSLPEATPYDSELDAVEDTLSYLQKGREAAGRLPTVMIIGASGKCGSGAVELCQRARLPAEHIIQCGREHTSKPGFSKEVLQVDILINCIYLSAETKPFITKNDLGESDQRLSVVSDVSCDGDDANNPIAVYTGHSSFKQPCLIIPVPHGQPLSIISIDHFPSLIPRDASEYCARQLLASLLVLNEWQTANEWKLAREVFNDKMREAMAIEKESAETGSSSSATSDASPDLGDGSSVNENITSNQSAISSLTSLESRPGMKSDAASEAEPDGPIEDPSITSHLNDEFDTRVVHAGHHKHDPQTGAVSMPISMASTYAQAAADQAAGSWVYSRKSNPNREDFEKSVAALEQAKYGLAFSSGSAAIAITVQLLEPQSNIIAISDAYAGTQRTFTLMAESLHITTTYVDATELTTDLGKHVTEQTKMVWVESPSNPLLQVVDLRAIADQAHLHGLLVVVDNTLASPYVFTPLTHGADIVIHSAAKYLAGHNDLVVGVLATSSPQLRSRLAFLQNAVGAVPSPFDCWLASRGLRTLHLRAERACVNAQAVAEALEASPHVVRVMYPGLDSHPGRDVVRKQHNHEGAGGGLVSFRVKGGLQVAESFCRSLRLFTLAESFGGVQSLCEVPGPMTHKLLSAEQRAEIGVHDDLVRLSMGVEATASLVEDVLQALAAACNCQVLY